MESEDGEGGGKPVAERPLLHEERATSEVYRLGSLIREQKTTLLDSLHLFTENTLTFAISVYLLAFSFILIYFQI